MTRNAVALASALVAGSIALAALIAGLMLPETMRLPVHWDLAGEPDAFAGKWTALLMPAGIVAAASLLFYFLPALEPRREGLQRSTGLYLWAWVAILMVGAVIEVAVLSDAFAWNISASRLIVGSVGAALVLIGNQMGKSRGMYLLGIRTPWTLSCEDVWIKTHRLGGKLMVAGGIAIFLVALLPLPRGLSAAVALLALTASIAIPIVYSFFIRPTGAGSKEGRNF
jgi:uncharacterized membrane protein